MPNPKVAVFLGAGASKPFGFPLTKEILPHLLRELHDVTLFSGINGSRIEKQYSADLKLLLRRILPGYTPKTRDNDLPLITDVLSLIDYSLSEGRVLYPGQPNDELRNGRWLMERAIFECLWRAEEAWTKQQAELRTRWGRWLKSLVAEGCGIISSNYDTLVDDELFSGRRENVFKEMDLGFSWLDAAADSRIVRMRPLIPRTRLYKLHGSLNWLRCECCEHLYVNPYGDIVHNAFRQKLDWRNTCHCGDKARLHMHVVAPSRYRSILDPNLLEIWKSAFNLLYHASEWIIIGYSFPPEDLLIRSLFLRAFQSRKVPPKVRVIQPNADAESRYRLIFPNAFTRRTDWKDCSTRIDK